MSTLLNIILLLLISPLLRPILLTLLKPQEQTICGICVTKGSDGQFIGITSSNKQYRFWNDNDTDNAETLISQENERISRLNSENVVTSAVVTSLTGDDNGAIDVGHYDLQGAYVAQKEANTSCLLDQISGSTSTCWYVRVLIANVGFSDNVATATFYAKKVASQLAQVAHEVPHFVGVMGWPFSTTAEIEGIRALAHEPILMISPSASSDALTAISTHFLRVAPPDSEQGAFGAQYAKDKLQAKKVAILYDPANPYSQTIATSFYKEFTKANNVTAFLEQYTRGDDGKIKSSLEAALKHQPNLIYFAGYTRDLNRLLDYLSREDPSFPLHIMGGDSIYDLVNFSSNNFNNFPIYFTSFAYFDYMVDTASNGKSRFSQEYPADFDPHDPGGQKHKDAPYGFLRSTSDGILAYDATMTLLYGVNGALNTYGSLSVDRILQVLVGSQDIQPFHFQGASGEIALGPDGNPIHKPLLVLCTNSGLIQAVEISGQSHDGGRVETKSLRKDCG